MTFVDVDGITETTDGVQRCSKACLSQGPKPEIKSYGSVLRCNHTVPRAIRLTSTLCIHQCKKLISLKHIVRAT